MHAEQIQAGSVFGRACAGRIYGAEQIQAHDIRGRLVQGIVQSLRGILDSIS